MKSPRKLLSLAALVVVLSIRLSVLHAADRQAAEIDFSRDIRPILSTACFHCHGPDPKHREADLRLDTEEGAFIALDGGHKPFVVGEPEHSEVFARLITKDDDDVMPPKDSGKEVTVEQIELIRRWIKQGAQWGKHWAFEAPKRPKIPSITSADDKAIEKVTARVKNPIDNFIFDRLEREGLSSSPQARKATLLRRLSLDLIGLPPTIAEIDGFLNDKSSTAWDKQVDRLLKSKHYGERWARTWLDAGRYADSDGFEKDKPREAWFYRDWVINALNKDLPYNQFVIEQIAGDLLPNASQDQIVATGFLRNSMINEEGGIDPEEFRMMAMFDRMDAVGKAVLGFTMQCAQCHNHKYDPLSHEDYYQVFSYLNNAHEAQPIVYTTEQRKKRAELFGEMAKIDQSLQQRYPDWIPRMAEWEKSIKGNQPAWEILKLKNSIGNNSMRYFRQEDGSYLNQGYSSSKTNAPFEATSDAPDIRAFQVEMLNHPYLPGGGPGRGALGRYAISEFKVKAQSVKDPEKSVEVKLVRATADYSSKTTKLEAPFLVERYGESSGRIGSVTYAIDGDDKTGWATDGGPGRHNGEHQAVFVADKNIAFPGGTTLTFTFHQRQGGWNSNDNHTMNIGRFRISLFGEEVDADPLPREVRKIIETIPVAKRSPSQARKVFSYWRTTIPEWKQANAKIEALWKHHPEGATQFVYQEMDKPRETHLLSRGDFLKPEKEVSQDVPNFLHSLPKNAGSGRLAFARWLVDRQSPTTARTIVNRIWQAYFGTGIYETADDLGSSGSMPVHPELLDWLAVELMENDWSLKHIHRLITQSSVYQQSSAVSVSMLVIDPSNRLLARGARFRVDAEIVRDIFLTASGLINPEIGGPSVYPPAPAFLFEQPASYGTKFWGQDSGADRYRRALYTFRFRSVPYPGLQAFDAPSGEVAVVRRTRSNTPLQALTTLNEPLFVESAQALAQLALSSGGKTNEERLTYIFRRCVARYPNAEESALLLKLLSEQTLRFEQGELDAEKVIAPPVDSNGKRLMIPNVASISVKDFVPAQLGGWTVVSRVILNMDETITKE